MRKTLFLLFALFSIGLAAQNNEGVIIYEDKYNIHRNLPPEMEAMKDRIPEFRTSKKVLYFDADESLYKAYVEEKKEGQEFSRRGYRWRGSREENEYYTNLDNYASVDHRIFFGREFLIEGERTAPKWKITAEQKQVGSYLCQKAILKDSISEVTAWFTPMIPVKAGPDDYFGLPGTILHVDINDGERMITAQSISLETLESAIERPEKGEKISLEEFEKIRDEKMKEMEQEYGKGSGRRYRFSRR